MWPMRDWWLMCKWCVLQWSHLLHILSSWMPSSPIDAPVAFGELPSSHLPLITQLSPCIPAVATRCHVGLFLKSYQGVNQHVSSYFVELSSLWRRKQDAHCRNRSFHPLTSPCTSYFLPVCTASLTIWCRKCQCNYQPLVWPVQTALREPGCEEETRGAVKPQHTAATCGPPWI